MSRIRVLLADDHPVVREGLKTLIGAQEDMTVVGEAGGGDEAHRLAIELAPDVAVLDVSMPGLGGVGAAELIRRDRPDCRLVALTVHEGGGYIQALLKAGVSGYVLKRSAGDDLVRAIRHVVAGGTYIDPAAAAQVVNAFVGDGPPGEGAGGPLTRREIEVVRLLARGHINREIAELLDLSIKTVEVHKARVLDKLGLRSRADLVQYALRMNWLDSP
ncbi:response regulator transcription factor [Paludisphaera sp.]|uniref:response regulator transcription factor n=1 Tax=Paludisphaera sp. TaxID=2017432 RepID=UPI00301CBF7F